MKKLINKLSISTLQEIIGDDILLQMEKLLPYFQKEHGINPSNVYEKSTLVKIISHSIGSDIIYDQKVRNKIFNSLPETKLNDLLNLLGIGFKPLDNFQQKVNLILKRVNWHNASNVNIVLKFLNLPLISDIEESHTYPNVETLERAPIPFKSLKNFQIQIFEACQKQLQYHSRRFLIQMPTGSGKTRTAMEVIVSELNKNPRKSIIWLANSEELYEQAIQCFKEIWMHLGQYDIDIIRMWGRNQILIPSNGGFIVAGFQKLHQAFQRNPLLAPGLSENLILLVIDEAHQIVAPTYLNVVRLLKKNNPSLKIIGLTATPGRGDINNSETYELINFFYGERVEIQVEDCSVFNYLKKEGILASVKKDPLLTDFVLTDDEIKRISQSEDFPKEILERISKDEARNVEILKKMIYEYNEGKKILFFATSIFHSKLICSILNLLNVKAEHLDATTKDDRRKTIIQEFKDGNLNILCNFGILTTGFDAPKVDVVFIARPTKSLVLYSQMVGRGLRGPAIGGTTVCKVIDVFDNYINYPNLSAVYEYFNEYWDSDE